jgi:hypothetical protein
MSRLGGLVQDDPVRSAVEASQVIDEHLQLRSRGEAIHDAELTEAAQLPQNQRRRRIELARVGQEVGRLVALPSLVRIDAEVGEQAVLRRHARKHCRGKPFFPASLDRFVSGIDEYPRMTVEDHAQTDPRPDAIEDLLDHFRVDHKSVFALAVAALVHPEECPRVGIQLFDPLISRRAHEKVQNLVGLFDGRSRLRGGLRSEPDARTDDRQTPASHRNSLLSLDGVDSGCVAGRGSADTHVDIHLSAAF